MDEDGYFYIVDRKKDMIISGGYNVYPRDIDEVYYGNPKVEEDALSSFSIETWRECKTLYRFKAGSDGNS